MTAGPSLRDMWMSEMWPTSRELSREERAVERARNGVNTRPDMTANVQVDRYSGGTTKDGPGGAGNTAIPALTPEAPEAPMHHAVARPPCHQRAGR